MSPMLDLSKAEEVSFDALPSGWYNAEIFKIDDVEGGSKGSEGSKLPAGTPQFNVQFKLLSNFAGETSGINNRRVFRLYTIPPADYEKADVMNGMILSFFKAAGVSDEEVKSGTFEPNWSDYEDRPVQVLLGQRSYNGNITNDVKQVRAPREDSDADGLI